MKPHETVCMENILIAGRDRYLEMERELATSRADAESLRNENATLRRGFYHIKRKLIEDCIVQREHPIVKSCEDPIGFFSLPSAHEREEKNQ